MADDGQDGLTQRERRAQRHKVEARKGVPGRMVRKAAVPAILVLLLAAVVAGMWYTSTQKSDCPGHWHATFEVYVPGDNGTAERVSFRHPAFDLSGQTPMRAHLHQSDGKNQFHFEQAGQCVGVEEAFRYVDVDLEADSLGLEGRHEDLAQAGRYEESGNQTLEVYIESASGEWRHPGVKSILDYQLKDGERVLVLFGDYTDEQVAQLQDAMPEPDSGRTSHESP